MASATKQSIVGASAEPPDVPPFVGATPVKVDMTPDQCMSAGFPPRIELNPDRTVTFFWKGAMALSSAFKS
jgi:hypothetical protein